MNSSRLYGEFDRIITASNGRFKEAETAVKYLFVGFPFYRFDQQYRASDHMEVVTTRMTSDSSRN